MESRQDTTHATQIHHFMQSVFSNCHIASQYYQDENAWRFQLSFKHRGTYSINPPMGCCMMNVQQLGDEVTFGIVLFVDDFKAIHRNSILN